MKKLILLIFFIALFFIIIPSTLAVCCEDKPGKEGGCYPGRGICCEEADKNVGYVGCKYSTVENPTSDKALASLCPNQYLVNSKDNTGCLICSSSSKDPKDCKPDGTGCTWIKNDAICQDLSCNVEYTKFEGKDFPLYSQCTYKCMEGEFLDPVKNECVKLEGQKDAICKNIDCASGKFCCKKGESYPAPDGTKGAVCSGDNDKDNICNYYDNCEEVPNSETLGTCLPLTIQQTCTKDKPCPQGGHCSNTQKEDDDNDDIGNACDYEELCKSAYGDRQCCDTLPGEPIGVGTNFGKTTDCNKCFTSCVSTITDTEGNELTITQERGPCINEEITITEIETDKKGVKKTRRTFKEPCPIPLIPFFTNINLIFTLLILTLFYYFRER